jgi:hypothetical protein
MKRLIKEMATLYSYRCPLTVPKGMDIDADEHGYDLITLLFE